MLNNLKFWWNRRGFRKAVAIIERNGYTVVQMVTVAGTNYIVDQQSGQKYRVGAKK